MTTMTTATPVLTAADRCDRCNAQAIVKRESPSVPDLPLLFCQHHDRVHGDALEVQGFVVTIRDEVPA